MDIDIERHELLSTKLFTVHGFPDRDDPADGSYCGGMRIAIPEDFVVMASEHSRQAAIFDCVGLVHKPAHLQILSASVLCHSGPSMKTRIVSGWKPACIHCTSRLEGFPPLSS